MSNNYIIISSVHQSIKDMHATANIIAEQLIKNYYRVGMTYALDDEHTAIKISYIPYTAKELEHI